MRPRCPQTTIIQRPLAVSILQKPMEGFSTTFSLDWYKFDYWYRFDLFQSFYGSQAFTLLPREGGSSLWMTGKSRTTF